MRRFQSIAHKAEVFFQSTVLANFDTQYSSVESIRRWCGVYPPPPVTLISRATLCQSRRLQHLRAAAACFVLPTRHGLCRAGQYLSWCGC